MKFGRKDLSLGRVYDNVAIREGDNTLKLHVNADPTRMVVGLSQAHKQLAVIKEGTPDEDREKAARFFAEVIFGKEQTQQLFDYYFGDSACVIALCGKYFSSRLSGLISKAQKKIGK